MHFDPTRQEPSRHEGRLTPVQSNLSSLWAGSDTNVESTCVNGADGKLEQLWVSARSERGNERFVYCNQASEEGDGFKVIPQDVAEQLSYLYQPIIRGVRTLTESMQDLFRVMEPSMWLGFWVQGVGQDMFELPAGLKTTRPVALMPTFEAFCQDPTLGRNLFAVAADHRDVGIFISEREKFSLIAFENSVYKIPEEAVGPEGLRRFTFAHATLLVDGSHESFHRAIEQFKVIKTWERAGGPSVMIARKRGEGAQLSSFRGYESI